MNSFIVKINSLNSTGQGVGSENGFKFFIDNSLPEEILEVETLERKKSYGIAQVKAVLEASSERIAPLCSLFGECGGCQLMHATYEAQLRFKRDRVVSAINRIAHLDDVTIHPCEPSLKKTHYRNKIQLPIFEKEGEIKLGLYKKNTHQPIEIDQCHIHAEKGESVLQKIIQKLHTSSLRCYDPLTNKGTLRHVLIRSSMSFDELIVIFITTGRESKKLLPLAQALQKENPQIKGVLENINTNPTNTVLSQNFRLLGGRSFIFELLNQKKFKVSASAFFQVNPFQAENLYKKALELAEITADSRVLDAYCGVGTLAIFAASVAKEVVGVEVVSSAIEDAKENAKYNHLLNCSFYCIKAEEWVKKDPHYDVVFLNPPRKGCDLSIINSLAKANVKKIIYISCDPETLARDLSLFVKLGYCVEEAFPFDMFPQTMHVETIVKITKHT